MTNQNENMNHGANGVASDIHVEVKQSILIQRLQKPGEKPCILINDDVLGIPEDTLNFLRGIFGFDYMGSSEFEMGAIPKALREIRDFAVDGKLVCGTLLNFQRPVYYICQKGVEGYVEELLCKLAEDDFLPQLMEWTSFNRSLEKENYEMLDCVGWLEMDNGFFFFVDKDMYLQTCYLFGLINEAPKGFKKSVQVKKTDPGKLAEKFVPKKNQGQSSHGNGNHLRSQNRRPQKPNFERDAQSEYVNALYLAKQKQSGLDVIEFTRDLCEKKIVELLEEASSALVFSRKSNEHKVYIAKAWAWANLIEKDIRFQVSKIYPQKDSVFGGLRIGA